MFRVPCPSCGHDLKSFHPKMLVCPNCGEEFKASKNRMFFKVRCASCGEIVEQPVKNINQHAPCPECLESSLIPAPPKYQEYLDRKEAELKAQKEKLQKEREEKIQLKKAKKKKSAGVAPRRRGRRGRRRKLPVKKKSSPEKAPEKPKREAVRKAKGQEDEEILYECAYCGAGISQGNIDRQEAENHGGLWYCWDHVPENEK